MRLPYLAPGETVWRFLFDLDQELFLDQESRRVVADAEGFGLYHVHEFDGDILVDGEPVSAPSGSYRESFTAIAERDTVAKIELAVGRGEPIEPVFWRLPAHVEEFAGWALPPEGWHFPQPVYNIDGLDPEELIGSPASVISRTLDGFFLSVEEDAKARGWMVLGESAFETVTNFPAPFQYFLHEASFRVAVPQENEGLQLVRIFDAFHGRQRATVLVDGEAVGVWYNPIQDREVRAHIDTFGIPTRFTRGKEALTITLDPSDGAPRWSSAFYSVDAMIPMSQ